MKIKITKQQLNLLIDNIDLFTNRGLVLSVKGKVINDFLNRTKKDKNTNYY